jgi:hypothetical protein
MRTKIPNTLFAVVYIHGCVLLVQVSVGPPSLQLLVCRFVPLSLSLLSFLLRRSPTRNHDLVHAIPYVR